MFDIYLFPFVPLFVAVAYPIFLRYVFVPVVFISKLQNLVLLSLYERCNEIKNNPFVETNEAIIEVMHFLLWLANIVRFLLKKRPIVNFFPRLLPFSLDKEISKHFNNGCGLSNVSWKPYSPSSTVFPILF